ncbi:MAG: hypothetical protein SV487_10225 [Thermodesulfobacteriota bacterium]|nr:hypothetical protein [Thermodesulfobacteriota bacterium]
MTSRNILFIRAILSIGAAFFLSAFFFGGINLITVALLAGLILSVAYIAEALRVRGQDKDSAGRS